MKRSAAPALAAAAVLALLAGLLIRVAPARWVKELWGDAYGDSWQNWWNGWWFGHAVGQGRSPMFTDALWWPDGVSLWLHTLGPLNAAATAAGKAVLPGFLGYNLLVFAHLVFGAWGAYALGELALRRAPGSDRLKWFAAVGVGVAFGFSPYVWGHIALHLHLTSIGFLALFARALFDAADTGSLRSAAAAGGWALALVLCGWYLLVDGAILGVAAVLVSLDVGRRRLGAVAAGGVASAVLCLPVLLPALAAQDQELGGKHDPAVYSADLLSLVAPSARLRLGEPFAAITASFTGNSAENTGYLGIAVVLLALVGFASLRTRLLAGLGLAGAAGLVLSLGPHLHVGGAYSADSSLPYAWLASLVPAIDGLGCPIRFALVTHLALAVGAGAGLLRVGRFFESRGARPELAVAALTLLVAVEFAPRHLTSSSLPEPPPVPASVGADEGVVDLTGWIPALWNQSRHERPQVHGYVSRRPAVLTGELYDDPVLGPLFGGALHEQRGWAEVASDHPDGLTMTWGPGDWAGLVGPLFRAELVGEFALAEPLITELVVQGDGGLGLQVDDEPTRLLGAGGGELIWPLELGEGTHRITLRVEDEAGVGRVDVELGGGPPMRVTRRVLRPVMAPRVSPEEAQRLLRERWRVGALLVPDGQMGELVRRTVGATPGPSQGGRAWYALPPR